MNSKPPKNLATLFQQRVFEYQDKPFLGEKADGQWNWISWKDLGQKVKNVSSSLIEREFQSGDKIGILAPNSPSWIIADLSTLSINCTSVPLYTTSTVDQIKFILEHSKCKALFCAEELLSEELSACLASIKTLKSVFFIASSQPPKVGRKKVASLFQLEEEGAKTPYPVFYERLAQIDENQLSSIIYTSGTTGVPKGVMLTHKNILSNAMMCSDILEVDDTDRSLSFLPLCHVFERTAGFYTLMFRGVQIAYAESIAKVTANLLEAKPTILFSVPRLLEKIYASIHDKLDRLPKSLKESILRSIELKSKPENRSLKDRILGAIYNRFVFQSVRDKFGGRLRFLVSGGAPLNPQIGKFLESVGIQVLQGYGLTETSPVISVNTPSNCRTDSVGPVLDELEVKLAEDGEILVKGDSIMPGYFENPQATKEAFDEDGFFRTGDIGRFDPDGHLVITDRKKDIIVTSGGKNVPPTPIENELKSEALIEQACVIGDQKKYLSALIVPHFEALEKKARNAGVSYSNHLDLIQKGVVQDWYAEIFRKLNAKRSSYESIKKFEILAEEFTVESDEMTPTMKLKRRNILKNHSELISQMYAE